jgi:hypothetical protein
VFACVGGRALGRLVLFTHDAWYKNERISIKVLSL